MDYYYIAETANEDIGEVFVEQFTFGPDDPDFSTKYAAEDHYKETFLRRYRNLRFQYADLQYGEGVVSSAKYGSLVGGKKLGQVFGGAVFGIPKKPLLRLAKK